MPEAIHSDPQTPQLDKENAECATKENMKAELTGSATKVCFKGDIAITAGSATHTVTCANPIPGNKEYAVMVMITGSEKVFAI